MDGEEESRWLLVNLNESVRRRVKEERKEEGFPWFFLWTKIVGEFTPKGEVY